MNMKKPWTTFVLSMFFFCLFCFFSKSAMAEEVSDVSNIRSFTGIDGGLLLENVEGYFWKDSNGVLTALHVPDDFNHDSFTLLDGYGIDTITGAVYQPIITDNDPLYFSIC